MLTPRENFVETVKKDGHPDRFVNQYEFMQFAMYPYMADPASAPPQKGAENKKNAWGVEYSWREDQPGPYPIDTPDKLVIKDFEEWQDYVVAPSLDYPESAWEPFIAQAEQIDRSQYFCTAFIAPGIFETIHNLASITETLAAFYEYEDELKELIKYIGEWELKSAEQVCDHLHPDMILHHDDWGSRTSTFLSPDMFADFFLEPYKEIYGYWHERGVQYVVHHSDSYCATLVPTMIDMGINVWQGCMTSNDIPALSKQYEGQLTFMGGLDGADIEYADWTKDFVKEQVTKLCSENQAHSFIPCLTSGLPTSTYPGEYECISECIDECSKEMPEKFQ